MFSVTKYTLDSQKVRLVLFGSLCFNTIPRGSLLSSGRDAVVVQMTALYVAGRVYESPPAQRLMVAWGGVFTFFSGLAPDKLSMPQ